MEDLAKRTSVIDDHMKRDMEKQSTNERERKDERVDSGTKSTSSPSGDSFSYPSFFTSVADVRPGQHNVNCLVRVLRLLIASSRPLHPFAANSTRPLSLSFCPFIIPPSFSSSPPSTSGPLSSSAPSSSASACGTGEATDIRNTGTGTSDVAEDEDLEDGMLTMYEFLVADATGSVKLVIYGRRHIAACKVGAVLAVVNAIASVVDGEMFLEVLEKARGKLLQTSFSGDFPVSLSPCVSDVPIVPLCWALPTTPTTY